MKRANSSARSSAESYRGGPSDLEPKPRNHLFGSLPSNQSEKSYCAVAKLWKRFNRDAPYHDAEQRNVELPSYFSYVTLGSPTIEMLVTGRYVSDHRSK